MFKFYFLLTSSLVFFVNLCHAQKESPPGTFLLKDNLFIDRDPISNINYAEFLASAEQFWSPEISDSIRQLPLFGINRKNLFADKGINWQILHADLIKSLRIPKTYYSGIDTSVTLRKYFTLEKIRHIPLTGINYTQAEMYCQWRTDMVRLLYSFKSANAEDRSRFYSKLTYRLPSKAEWEYALTKKTALSKRFPFYSPIYDVPKYGNRFFAYKNILGELLLEKDSIIFIEAEKPYRSFIQKNNSVSSQQIGFRCICEVVE